MTCTGLSRRNLGVDEHLVAGLHPVESSWIRPPRSVYCDLDARARGLAETARRGRNVVGVGEHETVVRETGRGDGMERAVVSDAARSQRVDALDSAGVQAARVGHEPGAVGVAGGRDAVGEQEHPVRAGPRRPLLRPREGLAEIRRAKSAASRDPGEDRVFDRLHRTGEHLVDALIEAREAPGRVGLGSRHGGRELAEPAHLHREVERPRRARVDQHEGGPDRLGVVLGHGVHAEHRDVGAAQSVRSLLGRPVDDEVAVGCPAAPRQRRQRHVRPGGGDRGVDLGDLRQSAERQGVGRRASDFLCVRDEDLLRPSRRDGEDARRQLVAGRRLEQGGVLLPVQEVLVGLAGVLLFDDLALLPPVSDAHREPTDRGALG